MYLFLLEPALWASLSKFLLIIKTSLAKSECRWFIQMLAKRRSFRHGTIAIFMHNWRHSMLLRQSFLWAVETTEVLLFIVYGHSGVRFAFTRFFYHFRRKIICWLLKEVFVNVIQTDTYTEICFLVKLILFNKDIYRRPIKINGHPVLVLFLHHNYSEKQYETIINQQLYILNTWCNLSYMPCLGVYLSCTHLNS